MPAATARGDTILATDLATSAAVELFFNGSEFFRRSGDAREPVGPLVVGEWYQVQLTLDLKAKTYAGALASRDRQDRLRGQLRDRLGWSDRLHVHR